METSNSTGKVVGALLIGTLLGAAAGILFAPDKGSKIRRRLMRGAHDMAEDLTDKLKEEADSLREKAMELEELAESKLREIKGTDHVKHKAGAYSHSHNHNS